MSCDVTVYLNGTEVTDSLDRSVPITITEYIRHQDKIFVVPTCTFQLFDEDIIEKILLTDEIAYCRIIKKKVYDISDVPLFEGFVDFNARMKLEPAATGKNSTIRIKVVDPLFIFTQPFSIDMRWYGTYQDIITGGIRFCMHTDYGIIFQENYTLPSGVSSTDFFTALTLETGRLVAGVMHRYTTFDPDKNFLVRINEGQSFLDVFGTFAFTGNVLLSYNYITRLFEATEFFPLGVHPFIDNQDVPGCDTIGKVKINIKEKKQKTAEVPVTILAEISQNDQSYYPEYNIYEASQRNLLNESQRISLGTRFNDYPNDARKERLKRDKYSFDFATNYVIECRFFCEVYSKEFRSTGKLLKEPLRTILGARYDVPPIPITPPDTPPFTYNTIATLADTVEGKNYQIQHTENRSSIMEIRFLYEEDTLLSALSYVNKTFNPTNKKLWQIQYSFETTPLLYTDNDIHFTFNASINIINRWTDVDLITENLYTIVNGTPLITVSVKNTLTGYSFFTTQYEPKNIINKSFDTQYKKIETPLLSFYTVGVQDIPTAKNLSDKHRKVLRVRDKFIEDYRKYHLFDHQQITFTERTYEYPEAYYTGSDTVDVGVKHFKHWPRRFKSPRANIQVPVMPYKMTARYDADHEKPLITWECRPTGDIEPLVPDDPDNPGKTIDIIKLLQKELQINLATITLIRFPDQIYEMDSDYVDPNPDAIIPKYIGESATDDVLYIGKDGGFTTHQKHVLEVWAEKNRVTLYLYQNKV